ncbi:MAG: ABC transporter permease, partial [Christensenellaceae bacterium]|nr:ABC transporter permease [Christensenellaceae bacterium]
MWKYILKRLITMVAMVLVVSFLVYMLMSLSPGDPVRAIAGENLTPEQLEELRESLGYNDPAIVRYFRYMKGVFQGDFGETLHGGKAVLSEYLSRLPRTLQLAGFSILLVIIFAIPFGIIAAVKHNSIWDTALSATAMCGLSVPSFWLGLMLIIGFALKLGWFPTSGSDQGFLSLILPSVTVAFANIALSTRITRSSMLDALRMDYLRTARAKGVSELKVVTKHAFKNALIPIVTIVGSQFCTMFNSAFVIESLFAWPGVGTLTLTAIRNNDANLVTGCVILTTILTALTVLLVDVLYAYIDP